MYLIQSYRPAAVKPIARHDDDCCWEPMPTGRMMYDEYDDTLTEEYDYVMDGSVPLTPFEQMMYASVGVQM